MTNQYDEKHQFLKAALLDKGDAMNLYGEMLDHILGGQETKAVAAKAEKRMKEVEPLFSALYQQLKTMQAMIDSEVDPSRILKPFNVITHFINNVIDGFQIEIGRLKFDRRRSFYSSNYGDGIQKLYYSSYPTESIKDVAAGVIRIYVENNCHRLPSRSGESLSRGSVGALANKPSA